MHKSFLLIQIQNFQTLIPPPSVIFTAMRPFFPGENGSVQSFQRRFDSIVGCDFTGNEMAIRLEIVGYFNVSPSYPKEQVERLVKTNASSILYSIAREMVRSITAAGPLFVSTNSGRSWLPATNLDRYWLAITCSSDGSKMAAQAIGDIVVPLVSTNYGETWESTAPLLNQSGSLASTAEGNKLMLAGGTGFYVSTNWGLTWFSTNHQAPVYGNIPMVCSANGSLILSCRGELALRVVFILPLISARPGYRIMCHRRFGQRLRLPRMETNW